MNKTMEFGELDQYLFGRGTHYDIYKKLGAHPLEEGVYFAVWAPNARRVSVVGKSGCIRDYHRSRKTGGYLQVLH